MLTAIAQKRKWAKIKLSALPIILCAVTIYPDKLISKNGTIKFKSN